MSASKLWLQCVGAFYLLMFAVAALVRLPIRVLGPEGTLERAAAGDPTARLLVDTWTTLGLEFAAVGASLLLSSRAPTQARGLIWTVIAIEVVRGIGTDLYMMAQGYRLGEQLAWIVVHLVIVATGLYALRSAEDHLVSAESSSSEMSKSL